MVFIYVLQCEEDKYYVGKTDTNKFRIDTHFDSNGSEFTKKYKPIDIYQIIPECDKYDEDKYVKKYMDKYGIDNVRGGTYSRIELTTEEKKFIQKELWGANDLCFLCGGEHFVKDCPNNTNKTENIVEIKEIVKCDNKLNFNISNKLNNMINKGNQQFEHNFNRMIEIIDEIINNVPDSVVAQNEQFIRDYHSATIGEFYKPSDVKAILFRTNGNYFDKNGYPKQNGQGISSFKLINIVILYKNSNPGPERPERYIYTKYTGKYDICINNTNLYVQKLNKYNFNTYTAITCADYERQNSPSFYIYF